MTLDAKQMELCVHRVEFHVKGTALEPYVVVIEKNGSNLNAFCTCPAGGNGQCCKHRLQLLSGNAAGVVRGDLSLLATVVDWVVGSDVDDALRQLALAEDQQELAKQAVAEAKKHLALTLRR